jgi:hypothetical protein
VVNTAHDDGEKVGFEKGIIKGRNEEIKQQVRE